MLHPYKMVKDVRTGVETTNAEAVLNGDIDEFLTGFLMWWSGKLTYEGERVNYASNSFAISSSFFSKHAWHQGCLMRP